MGSILEREERAEEVRVCGASFVSARDVISNCTETVYNSTAESFNFSPAVVDANSGIRHPGFST